MEPRAGEVVGERLGWLQGRRVGARAGMPYGKTVESAGLNLQMAVIITENMNRLDKGELGAFITYIPDAFGAFNEAGKKV